MAAATAPQSTAMAAEHRDPILTTSDAVSSTSPSSAHPSASVEMSDLDASGVSKKAASAGSQSGLLNDVSIPRSSPIDTSFPDATTSSSSKPHMNSDTERSKPENSTSPVVLAGAHLPTANTTNELLSSSSNAATTASALATSSNPATMTRLDSAAIGPSTEEMPAPVPTMTEAGPVLVITLLLTSGARHPYKIDEKYLTKRSVSVPGVTESGKKDPFSISVYTLKELILREWREEWEAQPSSPSSIRLIYFGRLLDDKTALKECRFNADSANVVHMTVRPQDIVDEEDASKGKGMGRDRGDGESNAGCRCVIL